MAINKLDSLTKEYWQLRSYMPVTEIIPGISGHFQMITGMLKGHLMQDSRNKLIVVAGKAAMEIGEMTLDSHDFVSTNSYFKAAFDAAQESGNVSLSAIALGRLGFLHIYAKQPSNAVMILQETHKLPSHLIHPSLQIWTRLIEAEAYALIKDNENCMKALERAEQIAEKEGIIDDPYFTDIENSTIPAFKGACYLHLKQPEKALQALQQALSTMDTSVLPRQSVLLADIATAYAQAGSIEESCAYAKQSILIDAKIKSGLTNERITKVRETLEPWRNSTAVKALYEELNIGQRI